MEVIGQTIDDAAGEAYDKCAKVMGLSYPGGPVIDRLAKEGNPERFTFNKPNIPGLDYSFSGLKTSFLYFIRDEIKNDPDFIQHNLNDLCASLQKTIVDILMAKLKKAAKQTGIKQIAIGGGVSANSGLQKAVYAEGARLGWEVFIPRLGFSLDNVAVRRPSVPSSSALSPSAPMLCSSSPPTLLPPLRGMKTCSDSAARVRATYSRLMLSTCE